jgi:hypothetical protein
MGMRDQLVLPPGATDSRTFQRYEFRITAKAMIYPLADGDDQRPKLRSVKTRDLSRGGMCFLHSKSLAPGQRVDLELPDGRRFTLEVRRTNRIEDGWYVIGCRFAGPSKPA